MNPLLDPAERIVIAHRGNAAHAPENTLESFEQAVSLGADALEVDVHLSSDGHVVAMHDPTVDRTTDGTGALARLTLAELERLDAGARFTSDGGRSFPWRARGVTVPTLEQVLDAFPGMPMIVEVKTPAASAATRRVLERHGAVKWCLVGSLVSRALPPFRGSPFPCCASPREVFRLCGRSLLPGSPRRLPYPVLCIPPTWRSLPLPLLRLARMARSAGACTHVWVVDDAEVARRYWNGGVNGIITNDPALMLAVAGRRRPSPMPSAV